MRTTLIAAIALTAAALVTSPAQAEPRDPTWSAAWTTAMQRPTTATGNWSTAGFDHQTIRHTIRLSTGGRSLRIRLSNQYGTKPLHLTGLTVGEHHLTATFHGSPRTTIATGRTITSDPLKIATTAGEQLTISLYVEGATGPTATTCTTTQPVARPVTRSTTSPAST